MKIFLSTPNCHAIPQSNFNCTYYLKFENLKIEFDDLMKKYKLDVRWDSQKNINKSKYCENIGPIDLSEESIKKIQKFYKDDFIKFNYDVTFPFFFLYYYGIRCTKLSNHCFPIAVKVPFRNILF